MKKLLLLFAFSILLTVAHSQDCKYEINKVDDFTGDTIKALKPENINKSFKSKYYFSVSMKKVNGTYFVGMRLTGGGQSLFISKDNSLSIKLKNDEIITLKADQHYTTDFDVISGVRISKINPLYHIGTGELEKIKAIGISKIRMETSDSFYDSDVKEKDDKIISGQIGCILL